MDLKKFEEKPFYLKEDDLEWVEKTFNSLSTQDKVEQVFFTFIPPDGIKNKKILEEKAKINYCGAYRFVNMSKRDLIDIAKFLQINSRIPLLMAGDLEFWNNLTFKDGTKFQRQMGVAATNDSSMAEKMAIIAAREGRALGFNWSFTPIVDLDYNHRNPIVNTRSFGSNPDMVLTMAKTYIKAMQNEKMAATAKHWPGDGMDERNQHNVTSVNSMDMENWRKTYGRIYKSLIDTGVLTVMSCHISLPAYYREKNSNVKVKDILPGSLSKELNIDLLRGELGFNGVIVSDALGMAGWYSQGRKEDLYPMVIENGCDICLFDFDEKCISYAIKGLETGKLSKKRLNEAVLRILALKAALGLHKKQKEGTLIPTEKKAKRILGCVEHKKWTKECAEKSITLVKDTQNIIPISPNNYKCILLIEGDVMDENIFKNQTTKLNFKKYLEEEGFKVSELQKQTKIDIDHFDLIIYATAEEATIINNTITINWYKVHKGEQNMIRTMERYWYEVPTIFISFGTPYHLYEVPGVKTYINCYTPIESVKKEVVQMLVGKKPFKGINPVDPFCGLEETKI